MRRLVVFTLLLLSACTHSVRRPEVGPDTVPIGHPGARRAEPLPALLNTRPGPHEAEPMPKLKPEKLMTWHIVGHVKNDMVYIGPHRVVVRLMPGHFIPPDLPPVVIPVAPEFTEKGTSTQAPDVTATPAANATTPAVQTVTPMAQATPGATPQVVLDQLRAFQQQLRRQP